MDHPELTPHTLARRGFIKAIGLGTTAAALPGLTLLAGEAHAPEHQRPGGVVGEAVHVEPVPHTKSHRLTLHQRAREHQVDDHDGGERRPEFGGEQEIHFGLSFEDDRRPARAA